MFGHFWYAPAPATVAPLQSPFVQNDWPNPQYAAQAVSITYAERNLPLTAFPFNQYDWPLPVTNYWYKDWTFSSETVLASILAKPSRQSDWPVPGTQPLVNYTWIDNGLSELPFATKPTFVQADFPNPQPVTWYQSWEWNAQRWLQIPNPQPFSSVDLANYDPPVTGRTYTYTFQGLLASSNVKPTAQYDWPNPQRTPWYQNWSYSTLIYQPAVAPSPHNQFDWPNPQQPNRIDQTFIFQPTKLVNRVSSTPFTSSTGITIPVQFVDETWVQASTLLLSLANPKPFQQSDWPVPVTFLPILQAFGENFILPQGPPFVQTDWPTPKTYPRLDQSYAQNNVLYLPAVGNPFVPPIWTLPFLPQPIDQFWIQSLVASLPAPGSPFSATGWDTPTGLEHIDKTWIQSLVAILTSLSAVGGGKTHKHPRHPSFLDPYIDEIKRFASKGGQARKIPALKPKTTTR